MRKEELELRGALQMEEALVWILLTHSIAFEALVYFDQLSLRNLEYLQSE